MPLNVESHSTAVITCGETSNFNVYIERELSSLRGSTGEAWEVWKAIQNCTEARFSLAISLAADIIKVSAELLPMAAASHSPIWTNRLLEALLIRWWMLQMINAAIRGCRFKTDATTHPCPKRSPDTAYQSNDRSRDTSY